jgi:hypothetical protein
MSSTENTPDPPHIVNGLLVSSFVKQERVDKLKDLELYPDDVWVVSYPKCGSTWTQQIVRLIRNNGVQDDVKIATAIPWVEAGPPFNSVNAEDVPRPRAFKSHFPYHLLPCGPPHTTPCKYIHVARNPKDVAVSFYFHSRITHFPGIEWDDYWKKFVAGDVQFGNYLDHFLSWVPHKGEKNLLFLEYEDMKKDLPRAVSQIASFLGVDLSSDVIDKIADLTSFDKMKNDNTANSTFPPVYKVEGATKFMRKGMVGDWKNLLTAEQSSEMDAIIAEKLNGSGVAFKYE